MVSQCGGAAGQELSGLANTLIVTTPFLASLIPAEIAFLQAFVWATGGLTIENLPGFCNSELQADPGVTAADIVNVIVTPTLPQAGASAAKINQLIQRWAWFALCQCADASAPVRPSAPTAPVLPSFNPPRAVVPNQAQPCLDVLSDHLIVDDVTRAIFNMSSLRIPGVTGVSYVFHLITLVSSGTPRAVNLNVDWFQGTTSLRLDATGWGAPPRVSDYITLTGPAGADNISVTYLGNVAGGDTSTYVVELQAWCNNLPANAPASPCCPPDPTLLGLVQSTQQLVTLIQRQIAPFAYVIGTAHAGISGSGTIAVQGLLGMMVAVTAYPAGNLQLGGTPSYVFDLGWMSIETADGFIEERRITALNQLWQPRLMSEATKFGYFLGTGVTATFTELDRET